MFYHSFYRFSFLNMVWLGRESNSVILIKSQIHHQNASKPISTKLYVLLGMGINQDFSTPSRNCTYDQSFRKTSLYLLSYGGVSYYTILQLFIHFLTALSDTPYCLAIAHMFPFSASKVFNSSQVGLSTFLLAYLAHSLEQ